jgi:hypothetical protein
MSAFIASPMASGSTAIKAIDKVDFPRRVHINTPSVGTFIGFTEDEVNLSGEGFFLPPGMFDFILPADEELWSRNASAWILVTTTD